MTAGRPWWLRLSAEDSAPWDLSELQAMRAALATDREKSRIGPALPPPEEPARPKRPWLLADRKDDAALAEGRMLPRPSSVHRVLDDMPHHTR